MQGDGQMILDGADITDLTIQELQTVPGQQAFLNRLSGRFEFRNVPPMMAMMAGVSPQAADRNLVVEIDGDSVKIHGTPIY